MPSNDSTPDKLIPDAIVIGEFGVTTMTLTRWTKDPKRRAQRPG
jgi:hypothetical protein